MPKCQSTRCLIYVLSLLVLGPGITDYASSALTKNGFDLRGALVPESEIYHGGPPRDGIPSIDRPRFIRAEQAKELQPTSRVLGMFHNDIAKAYPVNILNYHEIVNDDFRGSPVVITYCPLCGSGMAFTAVIAGAKHSFGVSGLLYNSDMLLYDRRTRSLWSQLMSRAISGPLKGYQLQKLNLANTTFQSWRAQHPDSLVLSTNTGYSRDYTHTPYPGYMQSEAIYFPVSHRNRRYHPKEQVIGLELSGQFKAYPFIELSRGNAVLEDHFAGQLLRIEFDAENRTGKVLDASDNEIPSVISFWFAWYAFHPDTVIHNSKAQ